MKLIFLTVVTFFAAAPAMAKITASNPRLISCVTMDQGDDSGDFRNLAKTTITLDAMGIATAVEFERLLPKDQKSDFLPSELDLKLDNEKDLISHGIRPNKVVDHDGGKLVFDWSIARVEFVTAASENGDSIDIAIHDHSYSGVPGSTIIYKKDGKTYNSVDAGGTTICTGAMKLDRK